MGKFVLHKSKKPSLADSLASAIPPEPPKAKGRERGKKPPAFSNGGQDKVGTEPVSAGKERGADLAVRPSGETTTTVTLEQKRSLPILTAGTVDLVAEGVKQETLPKFQCSTCAIGPECPEYKEGYVCAFNKAFDAFPVGDVDSVMEMMRRVIDRNKQRLMRAYLSEELVSGGQLDMNVTRMSEVVISQLQQLLELQRETQKATVTVVGPQQQGGILSKLFGAGGNTEQPLELNPPDVITARAEMVEEVQAEEEASEQEGASDDDVG